jgi:molybdate transport system regulatory protein
MTMNKKEIRFRCWIDIDGSKFFGPGKAELLDLIRQFGSISKAAHEMGISYRKAWSMVDDLNQRGQKPFVTLQKGGKKGGGAELTASGEKVVAAYHKMIRKIDTVIQSETGFLDLI